MFKEEIQKLTELAKLIEEKKVAITAEFMVKVLNQTVVKLKAAESKLMRPPAK